MPKSIPVVFNRSLLAIAIVSLSACSSTPRDPDFGLSSVGHDIARAGKATASASRKTWNKTTYLLGFSDSPDGSETRASDEQLVVADANDDQLLPIADMPAIERSDSDRPVLVQPATAANDTEAPQLAAANEIDDDNTSQAPREDLIYEVAANETLWDIAKTTTGNATNWHVLADVNSLEQSAVVFPGQKLVVPANLVKADYDSPTISVESAVAAVETSDVAVESAEAAVGSSETALESAEAVEKTFDTAVESAEATVESSEAAIETAESASDSAETTVLAQVENIKDDAAQNEIAAADTQRLTIPEPDDAEQQLSENSSAPVDSSQDAEAFEVGAGETLWDLAKRTTGDATNWQAIASHNNFTEKQATTVRPGQKIFVPQQMVSNYKETAAAATDNTATTTLPDSVATTTAITEPETASDVEGASAEDAGLTIQTAQAAEQAVTEEQALFEENALAEERAIITESELAAALPTETELNIKQNLSTQTTAALSIADETQDIKIVEATYKTEDTLDPAKAQPEPVQIVENESIPEQVMVSGTYYPKAVYNNADFSSSLLMRVSPGTTLQVSKAMGTWFEVKTDKGVGYVHQRDIQ